MKSEDQICEDLYSRHLRKFGYQLPYIKKIVRDIRSKSLSNNLWRMRGNLPFYSQMVSMQLGINIEKIILTSY